MFFNLQLYKSLTFHVDFCCGSAKSKQWDAVLLAFKADSNHELPPVITDKNVKPYIVLRMVKS
jgi:hypothetical protein